MTNDVYMGAPGTRRGYQAADAAPLGWACRFPKPDIRIANRDKWKASTIAAFEASRRQGAVS